MTPENETHTSRSTDYASSVMPTLERAIAAAQAAIDKKAENLKLLDVSKTSGFTDYFLICSGTSDRQVEAIAKNIQAELGQKKSRLLNMEGSQECRWILLDYGDVVIHVFLDALREYYKLEELWSKAINVPIPDEFYGPAAKRLN